ncbi:unnamed protein product, partial [Adineta steineri]
MLGFMVLGVFMDGSDLDI